MQLPPAKHVAPPSRRSAISLAEAIQSAALAQFRADAEATPLDLVAAHIYVLALAIAAVDDTIGPSSPATTSVLLAALQGLTDTVTVSRARLESRSVPGSVQ